MIFVTQKDCVVRLEFSVMETQRELKYSMFKVFEEELSIKDFEFWLYEQDQLSDDLTNELNLALYSFNYKQPNSCFEFKREFVTYFDEEEFFLWKAKSNLATIISGTSLNQKKRILQDFIDFGYECYEDYEGLERFGFNLYYYEDVGEPWSKCEEELDVDLKKEATELLLKICIQEVKVVYFSLKKFPYSDIENESEPEVVEVLLPLEEINSEKEVVSKWKFWK